MLRQVARPGLSQQPVARGALASDQRLGTGMANQQQHAGRLLARLGLLDLGLQRIQLLTIACCQRSGLLLCTKQLPQVPEVFIDRVEFGLAREQFNPHARLADLRQHRWRPHLFGTHQHIRTQAQNAFGGQLALIADTR
ncbi:hypothetical protein D3C80_1374770 [compost metagenome]